MQVVWAKRLQGHRFGQRQDSEVPRVPEACRALRQRRGPEAVLDHGRAWLTGAPEVLRCQVATLQVTPKLSCALRGHCCGQRQNSEVPRVQEACRALRQRRGPEAVLDHGRAWLTGAPEVLRCQVATLQVTPKLSCALRGHSFGQLSGSYPQCQGHLFCANNACAN